ncbi:MAG: hypothetical protein IKU00_09385 [Bacteroidales bacterium]|nr:hypothetical protein [Bacteroidales bacterium]
MKQLFDYCFYRIALFYKKRMPFEDFITQGHTLLISALGLYTIAIVNVLLKLLGIKLTKEIIILVLIPFCIIVFFNNRFFPNSEQLFEEKKKKYKNERCKWFKGFLVFLFVMGSFVSMVFSYKLK